MPLNSSDFSEFFSELHSSGLRKVAPFPWQTELAKQVCETGWPDIIDLPTASGKTACIDIAVFALACKNSAPRRIFFVVDRRVIVNEAYLRMQRIAKKLRSAENGILSHVARRLRELAGDDTADPLEIYELRGGIYRDESWVRTPLQPTIVASTVDQVGSRLLFRGYGVSDSSWPIHAGLIANDSLIFLDEAHCSQAFSQTLQSVRRYRDADWAAEPMMREFQFVEMTATPQAGKRRVFQIGNDDKDAKHLGPRIFASKPTRLVVSNNKPKELEKLAERLCQEALDLVKSLGNARRVAIMVNRVATARFVFAKLCEVCGKERVDLLIGRMRPIDRDDLTSRLEFFKSGAERTLGGEPHFVVATQCLEVGADLDFDILISECASIDALLQRFGRLNRLGELKDARGCIVVGAGQVDPKQPDPVYGAALAETWGWLKEIAEAAQEVNMGIEALDSQNLTVAQSFRSLPEERQSALRMESPSAPVLLPSHLDAWVQTSPRPHCESAVELFLHGPRQGQPDVQVVWRADLDSRDTDTWADTVSLCPPVASEAMPVPIYEFRRWFANQEQDVNASDLEGIAPQVTRRDAQGYPKRVFVWLGKDSRFAHLDEIKPGNTIVLPVREEGWNELGHIPDGAEKDCGDRAQRTARHRLVLRLHPKLLDLWPAPATLDKLKQLLNDPDTQITDILEALFKYRSELTDAPEWFSASLGNVAKQPRQSLQLQGYPNGDGFVLSGKRQVHSLEEDDGSDAISGMSTVLLEQHLADVEKAIGTYRDLLVDKLFAYEYAARLHDYGKADIRFQTLLRNGDGMAARLAQKPLAKSSYFPISRRDRQMHRQKSALPDGFRHELLSLLFAQDMPELSGNMYDLALHLIATHHGYCRPFAPVVLDQDPPNVSFRDQTISSDSRQKRASHRLDSGVPDRFWRLVRHFGWWGLAYQEALFRLADWEASARETKNTGAA